MDAAEGEPLSPGSSAPAAVAAAAAGPVGCRPSSAAEAPLPVVVVLGATGVGKSKLGIDIAHALGGEVVNADALQVYQGLPITTNKVPEGERRGVPHHLLDLVPAHREMSPRDFRDAAVAAVAGIAARGRLPVIVGGSNYYVQALVSLALLDDWAGGGGPAPPAGEGGEEGAGGAPEGAGEGAGPACAVEDPAAMYARLRTLDPEAADRLHPNDTRKVKRYLEISAETGQAK